MATLLEIETFVQTLIGNQDLNAFGWNKGTNIVISVTDTYSRSQLEYLINQFTEIYDYIIQQNHGWMDIVYTYVSGTNTIQDVVDYVQNLIDNKDIHAFVWSPDATTVKLRFRGQYKMIELEHLITQFDEITDFSLSAGYGLIDIYYLYDETLT